MAYSINQLAMITCLTTRTLRTHLKQGILSGEKIDGNWCFTEEDVDRYLAEPAVKRAAASKQRAVIYDFLAESFRNGSRTCTILDIPAGEVDAWDTMRFFCDWITKEGRDIEFRFAQEKNFARFILAGDAEQVKSVMKAYYER